MKQFYYKNITTSSDTSRKMILW